jgi:hypothetical protein
LVRPPDFLKVRLVKMGKLVDQSPSISCSVVGIVPKLSIG